MVQDIILTLANAVLGLLLLPTLVKPTASVPRWTSIPTGTAIFVIGATYFTLGLWIAGTTAVVQAGIWGLIAIYRPDRET